MVRSLSKRGMPKPFAILIAALLALYFVPLGRCRLASAGNQLVGGFEIDGNFPAGNMAPAGDDWSSFPPQPVGTDPVGNLDISNSSSGSEGVQSTG